jgi:hypothetical protein
MGINTPKPLTTNLNPKAYTLNPKAYTLSPKAYTLNPKAYTLNPKRRILHTINACWSSWNLWKYTCMCLALFSLVQFSIRELSISAERNVQLWKYEFMEVYLYVFSFV